MVANSDLWGGPPGGNDEASVYSAVWHEEEGKIFGDEAGLKERIEVKVDFPTGDYETLLFFLFSFFKAL